MKKYRKNFAYMGMAVFIGLIFVGSGLPAQAQSTPTIQTTFFIKQRYDATGRSSSPARLMYESQHAYFYADATFLNGISAGERAADQTDIRALAHIFDTVVYPRLTTLLGDVWDPGIDNDPHVYVLLSSMIQGVGGYFNPLDEFPKSQFSQSNEHEIIYLNIKYLGQRRIDSFMAHEFQHLITFNQKNRRVGQDEIVWLNELRSETVPTILGFDDSFSGSNLQERTWRFIGTPSASLADWTDEAADYGTVAMLGNYLLGRFGTQLFHDTEAVNGVGIPSINAALFTAGASTTFDNVYADWMIANVVNDRRIDNGQYGYQNPFLNFHITPSIITDQLNSPSSTRLLRLAAIKPYEPHWVRVAASPVVKTLITIQANDSTPLGVGYIIQNNDGTYTIEKQTTSNGNSKLQFVLPDLKKAVSGTLAIAYFSNSAAHFNVSISLSAAPDINPQAISVDKLVVPARKNFSLHFMGPDILPGARVRIGSNEPVTLQATSMVQDFLLSSSGLNPGSYTLKIANPQGSFLTFDTLTVRGELPDDRVLAIVNTPELFLVRGNYWRSIDSNVAALYNHLTRQPPLIVLSSERTGYTQSTLVKAAKGTKVYSIDARGQKHWLDMSALAFTASGRQWGSVFIVNDAELATYHEGSPITE